MIRKRLREGNLRFASSLGGSDAFMSHTRRAELMAGQHPFSIILGCSDSRVPAEIVFDRSRDYSQPSGVVEFLDEAPPAARSRRNLQEGESPSA